MALFGKKETPQTPPNPGGGDPFTGALFAGDEDKTSDFIGEVDSFVSHLTSEMKGKVKVMEEEIKKSRDEVLKLVKEEKKLTEMGHQLKTYYTGLKAQRIGKVENTKLLQSRYVSYLRVLGIPDAEIVERLKALGIRKEG